MNSKKVIKGSVLRPLEKSAFLLHPHFFFHPSNPTLSYSPFNYSQEENLVPINYKSFHFSPLKETTDNISTCNMESNVIASSYIKAKIKYNLF